MIELRNVHKSYLMGDTRVHALRGVSLNISEGEFIAIMGPSGSGKSTLMHVLGLLDTPDSGEYRLLDHDISKASDDELSSLRCSTVGFVFQQFNLLSRLTAIENVVLPRIYSPRGAGLEEGTRLMKRFGMGDRLEHKPNELSGGQQQRVAIARSLINEPKIILADEPTGNLDTKSSEEIIGVIEELNREGITVILVTHEEDIARHARRLIRMRDGQIQSDEQIGSQAKIKPHSELKLAGENVRRFRPFELFDHVRQGFKTLAANKVRTGLSMLGVLIGVAAVVAMLALGQGAKTAIETQLASLGSNLLVLRSGASHMGGVVLESGATTRLTMDDAQWIKESVQGVANVGPTATGRAQVSFQDKNWNTQVVGAGPAYAAMRASMPESGRFFSEEENLTRARVALLGMTVIRNLFGDANPIGETIRINKVTFLIIGILPVKGATGFRDQDDTVVIPVLTAMHRLFGKEYVDSIDIEADSAGEMDAIQSEVLDAMITRHRVPSSLQQNAFEIRNMADIKATMEESSRTMSMLLSAIAAISLLVGGVGIMNIMLVSVAERTPEIGLRKAVGARRFDLLTQFLTEAVVVSAFGGLLGIALGWGTITVVSKVAGWASSISLKSALLAFLFSGGIGVLFGFYPARKASLLNPIEALRYE